MCSLGSMTHFQEAKKCLGLIINQSKIPSQSLISVCCLTCWCMKLSSQEILICLITKLALKRIILPISLYISVCYLFSNLKQMKLGSRLIYIYPLCFVNNTYSSSLFKHCIPVGNSFGIFTSLHSFREMSEWMTIMNYCHLIVMLF